MFHSRETVMKLRPIVFAVLAACSGIAGADSSLAVFGIVDLAGRVVSNDEKQYQLASGGLQTSRLGFRGTEDLGGGVSAGFWLEGKLSPDTSGGFSFDRRSTVSLTSQSLGEMRLGRDRVPSYFEWEDYDPFVNAGLGASTQMSVAAGLIKAGGDYNTFTRADNLAAYFTPGALGGIYAHLAMAAGEGQLGNKYYGARLGYREGPIAGSASYGRTQVSADDDAVVWSVGGAYDFRPFRLMGFYSELDVGTGSQSNWRLGFALPMGAFELRAAYQAMEGGGDLSGYEATHMALGLVYSLSKRTALYTTYATIDNTMTAFTVGSGSPLTPGNRSSGLDVGMRHAF